MHDDEMDSILSVRDEIVPSSGFTSRVMDAVRREAAEPPPIAFPWKRALPGLVVWVGALLATFVFARSAQSVASKPMLSGLSASVADILHSANRYGVGWILLALTIPAVSVAWSLWLTQRHVKI
jgi:hypothetical protein